MRATALILLIASCGDSNVPPDASVDAFASPRFVEVTTEVGLGDLQQWDEAYPVPCYLDYSIDCRAMEISGGIAVRDVDGDGRTDVFFPRMEAPDVLLRNTLEGFVDVSSEYGLPSDDTFSNGAAFADVDNDGDPDLYVTTMSGSAARFYELREGTYVDAAETWGVAMENGSLHSQMSACFGDVDNDGLLDLHTTEWRSDGANEPNHARLMIRDGETFVDETDRWQVSMKDIGRDGLWSFTSSFIDLDGDFFPELLVAADFGSSRLFRNARSFYIDVTSESRVGTEENGMGSAIGDIDGDGDLDWFVSSIFDDGAPGFDRCVWGSTGNRMYRNDDGAFTDITDSAGVREGGWGWGARFFDYDLDGDLDLILTNGSRSRCGEGAKYAEDLLRLWRNDGSGVFEEVSEEEGIVSTGVGRGVITFDYDLDGDEDVLISYSLDGPRLWRNDAGNGRAWLEVHPVGNQTNRDGTGTVVRVRATPTSRPMVRHSGNGCGFLGHSPGYPRFGLGDLETVHEVEVLWPTGRRQVLRGVPTRQVLLVAETESEEPGR